MCSDSVKIPVFWRKSWQSRNVYKERLSDMEDAHTHLLSLPDDKEASFFAVYDGHGGPRVSQYAGNHLHKKVVQAASYVEGRVEEGMREGFLQLDADMTQDEEMKDEMAGTTAVAVLVKAGRLHCANVGDSRAVVCLSFLGVLGFFSVGGAIQASAVVPCFR